MRHRHRKFNRKRLIPLIVGIFLSVVLYTSVYYFFQFLVTRSRGDLLLLRSDEQKSTDRWTSSHLPATDISQELTTDTTSVILPVIPGVILDTSTEIIPEKIPTPEKIAIDTSNLPSAAVDRSALTPGSPQSELLSFGSFQETFVGSVGIDLEKTTLYHDDTVTAMFFAPDYSWETASQSLVEGFKNDFSSVGFNNFNGPYEDERCLGNNCLKQKGLDLFYNAKILLWPKEINGYNVTAISIATLTKNWLVGFTIRDGDGYSGQVFYFNGKNFIPLVLPAKISSASFGLFGFGGEESDFIVVYGSPQAVAYRFRGGSADNISRWFYPRLMGQGFKPEFVRVDHEGDIVWYVYSSTLGKTELIKLWQNGTPEIVGEAVFNDLLDGFNSSMDYYSFKVVANSKDSVVLLVGREDGGVNAWHTFTDRGFKNTKAATIITNPITKDGLATPIIINKIASAKLLLDQGSLATTKFLFSEDAIIWRDVPSKINASFVTNKIKDFRLQVAFPSFSNHFYSPFLSEILFDYYATKF